MGFVHEYSQDPAGLTMGQKMYQKCPARLRRTNEQNPGPPSGPMVRTYLQNQSYRYTADVKGQEGELNATAVVFL